MPYRLAIVDDDHAVRTSLQRLLSVAGFEVDLFPSGEALLESSMEHFHCILLDLSMPGMGGLAVLEELAEKAPELPVVVLTGSDIPGAKERAHELGAQAVVWKPAEAKVLLEAIHSVTRQRG